MRTLGRRPCTVVRVEPEKSRLHELKSEAVQLGVAVTLDHSYIRMTVEPTSRRVIQGLVEFDRVEMLEARQTRRNGVAEIGPGLDERRYALTAAVLNQDSSLFPRRRQATQPSEDWMDQAPVSRPHNARQQIVTILPADLRKKVERAAEKTPS